jgi:hypothetical protein
MHKRLAGLGVTRQRVPRDKAWRSCAELNVNVDEKCRQEGARS